MSVFDRHKDGIAIKQESDGTERERWQSHFAQAVAQEDWYHAYRLYRQMPADGDNSWLAADAVYPLARYAADERKGDDALAIVEGFSRRYPTHDDVVKNYVVAAQVMAQQFGEKAQAQALLTQLATHYQEHQDISLITQAQTDLA